MKRSRSIELVLMGTMPLLLSAFRDCSAQQPQNAFAYQNLQQCINEGKVSADVCEKAYADAVQAQYRDGPRYNTLAEGQAQFGYDQCRPVQTSSASWFMPALAGFMIGRALGSNHYYNYQPGYAAGPFGGGFGQPL